MLSFSYLPFVYCFVMLGSPFVSNPGVTPTWDAVGLMVDFKNLVVFNNPKRTWRARAAYLAAARQQRLTGHGLQVLVGHGISLG